MALKDILAKLKGLMPEGTEDEEIAAKSKAFQAEEEAAGAKPMPEEGGLEDGDYLPGGAEDYINPRGIASKLGKVGKMMMAAKSGKALNYATMGGPKIGDTGLKVIKDIAKAPTAVIDDAASGEAYLFSSLAKLKDRYPDRYKAILDKLKNKGLADHIEK